MTARAERAGAAVDAKHLRGLLAWRERAGSTHLGRGAAIPHARSIAVVEACFVVGRSSHGVVWEEEGEASVHLVLMALSPAATALDVHLDRRAMSSCPA
jgi:mannitol/fructose-specific phosphotransferase system IIA component (Ntr-type)